MSDRRFSANPNILYLVSPLLKMFTEHFLCVRNCSMVGSIVVHKIDEFAASLELSIKRLMNTHSTAFRPLPPLWLLPPSSNPFALSSLWGKTYTWSDYDNGCTERHRVETPWGQGHKCPCGNAQTPKGPVWVTITQMWTDLLASGFDQDKIDHKPNAVLLELW